MFKVRSFLKPGERKEMPAKEAIDRLLFSLRFNPAAFAVFDVWDKETAGLVRGCEALGLIGSRLHVRVPSTVHRQELIYVKDRLISRINQAMGQTVVTDIAFELN